MRPNYESCKYQNIRFPYKKNKYQLERLNFQIGTSHGYQTQIIMFVIVLRVFEVSWKRK